jgi:hypothetical protein
VGHEDDYHPKRLHKGQMSSMRPTLVEEALDFVCSTCSRELHLSRTKDAFLLRSRNKMLMLSKTYETPFSSLLIVVTKVRVSLLPLCYMVITKWKAKH